LNLRTHGWGVTMLTIVPSIYLVEDIRHCVKVFIYLILVIVFYLVCKSNRPQRPFRHSKTTYSKKIWTNKNCKIKINFTSKNPFAILIFQSKFMDKIQRGYLKMSKKMSISTPLWTLSINFDWRVKISNGFLEMKFRVIF